MPLHDLARALQPGGRFAAIVWRPLSENEFFAKIREALALGRHLPMPQAGTPGPFGLSDPGFVRDTLGAAGFSAVTIDVGDADYYVGDDVDDAFVYTSTLGFARGALADLDDAQRAEALVALRSTLAAHDTGAGVVMASGVWVVTASCASVRSGPATRRFLVLMAEHGVTRPVTPSKAGIGRLERCEPRRAKNARGGERSRHPSSQGLPDGGRLSEPCDDQTNGNREQEYGTQTVVPGSCALAPREHSKGRCFVVCQSGCANPREDGESKHRYRRDRFAHAAGQGSHDLPVGRGLPPGNRLDQAVGHFAPECSRLALGDGVDNAHANATGARLTWASAIRRRGSCCRS